MIDHSFYITLYSVSVLAALITLSAGILPIVGRMATGARLHFLLGTTAGVLLTTAFMDLVPEAMTGSRATGLTMAIGFLALYAVEWAVGVHGHGEAGPAGNAVADTHFQRHAPHLPLVAFTALGLHRLVDGMTLPAAFGVGQTTGFTAAGAILIHQFPDGFAAAVLLLAGGWPRRRVMGAVGALAVLTPLGTLLGVVLVGVPGWLPHMVALAAVTFIFIGAAELMPELHHGPHKPAVGAGLGLGCLIVYLMHWFGGP
ncbi:MAG TPA: ZIP family metal transporter [Candidatus Binatia bacterium]